MINKIKIRLSILILSLVAIISIMTISISGEVKKISNASQDYKDKLIRFHVIANSDSDEDQNLKLKVRDAVINYLQPKLLESESIEESELIIKREYSELEKISKNIILQNGYNYDVKISEVDSLISEVTTAESNRVQAENNRTTTFNNIVAELEVTQTDIDDILGMIGGL